MCVCFYYCCCCPHHHPSSNTIPRTYGVDSSSSSSRAAETSDCVPGSVRFGRGPIGRRAVPKRCHQCGLVASHLLQHFWQTRKRAHASTVAAAAHTLRSMFVHPSTTRPQCPAAPCLRSVGVVIVRLGTQKVSRGGGKRERRESERAGQGSGYFNCFGNIFIRPGVWSR